jgi:uncharacterized membrane protein YbhN (UPF0104 family)
MIGTLVIAAIVLFIFTIIRYRETAALGIPAIFAEKLRMLVSALSSQMNNTKGLIYAFLVSIISQCVFAFGFMIAGFTLGVPLGFGDYVVCCAVVQVAGLLPVSVAGIGLKDVTLITILSKSGLHQDSAAAIVLSGYPATIVLVGLGYLALIRYRSRSKA